MNGGRPKRSAAIRPACRFTSGRKVTRNEGMAASLAELSGAREKARRAKGVPRHGRSPSRRELHEAGTQTCTTGLVDILRCQVRTLVAGSYGPCGAEARKFQIVDLEGQDEPYSFVVCDEHANRDAEDIGLKSNDELREHIRFLGATPAF
jgi:hypothetical protein